MGRDQGVLARLLRALEVTRLLGGVAYLIGPVLAVVVEPLLARAVDALRVVAIGLRHARLRFRARQVWGVACTSRVGGTRKAALCGGGGADARGPSLALLRVRRRVRAIDALGPAMVGLFDALGWRRALQLGAVVATRRGPGRRGWRQLRAVQLALGLGGGAHLLRPVDALLI